MKHRIAIVIDHAFSITAIAFGLFAVLVVPALCGRWWLTPVVLGVVALGLLVAWAGAEAQR